MKPILNKANVFELSRVPFSFDKLRTNGIEGLRTGTFEKPVLSMIST